MRGYPLQSSCQADTVNRLPCHAPNAASRILDVTVPSRYEMDVCVLNGLSSVLPTIDADIEPSHSGIFPSQVSLRLIE